MSIHVWSFVYTAWEMLRTALSTSNLSLVVFSLFVPLAVFVVAVLVKWSEAWSRNGLILALRSSVKPVVIGTAISLFAWGCLFSWAIYKSVYNDHQNLAGRLRVVVNEKDALKVGVKQRDDYIKRLENVKCPQRKTGMAGLAAPAQASSASLGSADISRHLTPVQKVRLKRLFSEVDSSIELRVQSVANDTEAMQYANEINDVLNSSRGTTFQVIRGISWARVPQGMFICLHDENNLGVKGAAGTIAQEMILIGMAVLYNANESWPTNRVTVVVGTKPIT